MYAPLAALTLMTLAFIWHVLWRLFPPAWPEVLADYQIVSSYTAPSDGLFRHHTLKLRYEVEGKSFEKLAPVRYNPRTLQWEVIPQPHDPMKRSKLLIRVHPRKPKRIYYRKINLWHLVVPAFILACMWVAVLSAFSRQA